MSTATSQPRSASAPTRSSQPGTEPGAKRGDKKAAARSHSRWASPALVWGTVIVSFFVLLAGWIVYARWKYSWVLLFTTVLSSVFSLLNMLKPEIHDQTLVPALQSVFFIPHVTVYMFAYGILACAFILAVAGIFDKKRQYFVSIDNLVYIGIGLLFIGMLTGMIWAKQAWGDFWDWDPKETWAAVTIAGYLLYIHLRLTGNARKTWLYVVVIVSFLLLQMCWYGYRYLPSSLDSMHLYKVN